MWTYYQPKEQAVLKALYRAEAALPSLLLGTNSWKSLYVDYHPPIVERLWRDWEEHRLYLHCIHPCPHGTKALLHPHPWPSGMRVHGRYKMGIGYGKGDEEPLIAATLSLIPGAAYEMMDPDGWHYVDPLDTPSLSVMITGKPWGRPSPKSDRPLGPLSEKRCEELLAQFRALYPG